MASRQEKEKREETAASDLSDVKRDKERERPGVIGSVIKVVQSAKEAVVRKTNDTRKEDVGYCAGDIGDRDRLRETKMMAKETTELAARTLDEKAREMKERARERTPEMSENAKDAPNETKGYVAEKVREATERTKQMAESVQGKTKDTAQSASEKTKEKAQEAKEKTLETSQLVADKTKHTALSAVGKLGELKDKAMGLFSGKKEEAKERMYEATGTAKEKPREMQEDGWWTEEENGLTDRNKYEGDLAPRASHDKDEGKEDGGRVLEALGALMEKLTLHMSNGNKTRQSTDASRVVGRNKGEKKAQGTSEEKGAEACMEDTSPGAIASALKASDQITRRTFNDNGQIDDEGVIRIVHRDQQGKM